MQQIAIVLDINEAQQLMNVLGELPIKSGLAPLAGKILAQANDQLAKQEEKQDVAVEG